MKQSKEKVYKRRICPAFEVGKYGGCRRFYIDIEFSESGCLSICGEWHGCGQICDELTDDSLIPSDGFEYADLLKIQTIWKEWHLNDMRAGTPKQEAFIKQWRQTNKYDYTKACKALEEVGLLFDNGYKYGSSWLKEDVPNDVIRYLFTLPCIKGDSWGDIDPTPVNEDEFFNILG